MRPHVFLSDALNFGWRAAIDHYLLNLKVGFIYLIFYFLTGAFFLPYDCMWNPWCRGFSLSTIVYATGVGLFLSFFFMSLRYGLFAVYLDYVDTGHSRLKRLFSQLDFVKMLKIFAVSILLPIVITVGFFLFLIPGFIALTRFFFVPFFIIDQDCGIVEAFSKSYKATEGNALQVFWLILLQVIFGPLSSLMVLFPFLFIAEANFYRQLEPKMQPIIFYPEL